MEYYNLLGKRTFEVYYRNKVNQLLLNEEVEKFLDAFKINLNEKFDLNLFPGYDKIKFTSTKTLSRLTTEESVNSNNSKQFLKQELTEKANIKIKEVEKCLSKIDGKISTEIVHQMEIFEKRKREKVLKYQGELGIKAMTTDSNEKIVIPYEEGCCEGSISRVRAGSVGRSPMMKEIEEYIEKYMKEMFREIEEIKSSYEGKIKNAKKNYLLDIEESLKEDMNEEIENLKIQYEEQRDRKIDLIKGKHTNKDN